MAECAYILLLVYTSFGLLLQVTGIPSLEISRRVPVDGLSLELTCKLSSSSPFQVYFTAGSTTAANCSMWSTGSCSLSNSTAYLIRADTSRREVTLTIRSFTTSRDGVTWSCTHSSQSNQRLLQDSSSILEWQNVTVSPVANEFPDRINDTASVAIVVNTPCAKGQVNVTLSYTDDKGASGSLSALTNTPTSCSESAAEKRTIVYSLSGNSPGMRGKLVQFNISLEHDSFPPENGYTRSILRGPTQFPVRVDSVTLRNISRDEEVIKVLKDTDLVLVCESSPGFPTVVIQWYKHTSIQPLTPKIQTRTENVTSVVKRTISTFTMRMSTSDNDQMYYCVGSNSQHERQSFKAKVSVLYPPSIPTLSPSSPRVLEEGHVTLTCLSSERGNPQCTYIWMKNGIVLSHKGSTYILEATHSDNGASLQCQAINEYTNRTSVTLTSPSRSLTVYYKPRVSVSPTSLSKKEGDSMSVTCSSNSNPPSGSYTWTSPRSTTLASTAVLTKSSLSRDDHGSYVCKVVVSAPSYGQLSGSATLQVTVNYAPDITMTSVTTREGEKLKLECRASGRPSSYSFQPFEQYWESTRIKSWHGSKVGSGSTYTLEISSATYQEWGYYECSVDNGISNRAGVLRQTKRVLVNVQAPPVNVGGSKSLAVENDKDINITLAWFSRTERPTQEWRFEDGSPVTFPASTAPVNVSLRVHSRYVAQPGYQIRLTLTRVQQNNFGTYINIVCNSIGCRNTTVLLRASGPPLVPLDFTVVNTSTESAWLRWKPNFPGGNYIQYFVLHYRVKGSGANWTKEIVSQAPGNFTYKRILGLQIGTTYTFKLQSRNNHPALNQGPFTDEIYLETKGLNQDGGIGAGVGIGVGAMAGIVLLVVAAGLTYKFRRQIQCVGVPCHIKRKSPDTSDEAQEAGDAPEGTTNYSALQKRPGPSLHSYEGIVLQPKTSSSSAVAGETEDPYVNTTFHKKKKGGKPAILPKPVQVEHGNRAFDGHVYQNYC